MTAGSYGRAGVFVSVAACIVAILAFLTLYETAIGQSVANHPASIGDEGQLMRDCEVRTWAKLEENKSQDVATLVSVTKYCFSDAARQAMLVDYAINRTGYRDQASQSKVLLWLVVVITFSGVALSAVQLGASYKLASAASAKEMGDQGGAFDLEAGRISVRSSVTGLMILAISFAFFIVFVKQVYTLTDRFLDPATETAAMAEKDVAASNPAAASSPIGTPLLQTGVFPATALSGTPRFLPGNLVVANAQAGNLLHCPIVSGTVSPRIPDIGRKTVVNRSVECVPSAGVSNNQK